MCLFRSSRSPDFPTMRRGLHARSTLDPHNPRSFPSLRPHSSVPRRGSPCPGLPWSTGIDRTFLFLLIGDWIRVCPFSSPNPEGWRPDRLGHVKPTSRSTWCADVVESDKRSEVRSNRWFRRRQEEGEDKATKEHANEVRNAPEVDTTAQWNVERGADRHNGRKETVLDCKNERDGHRCEERGVP